MLKQRVGNECKQMNCKNYEQYSHWFQHLGERAIIECMECKHAHVSQYQRREKGGQSGAV